jgi:hypothetical protein
MAHEWSKRRKSFIVEVATLIVYDTQVVKADSFDAILLPISKLCDQPDG